jgi:hypothetical protein
LLLAEIVEKHLHQHPVVLSLDTVAVVLAAVLCRVRPPEGLLPKILLALLLLESVVIVHLASAFFKVGSEGARLIELSGVGVR